MVIIKATLIAVFTLVMLGMLIYYLRQIITSLSVLVTVIVIIGGFIGGLILYNYAFSEIYKFNNTLGIIGVFVSFSALVYYLNKKINIIAGIKSLSGINEYDKNAKFLNKVAKILSIGFSIFIMFNLTLGFLMVFIFSIFNPNLAN